MSPMHFLTWLVLAAPASFFSAAVLSQAAMASFTHFVIKLSSAAPASFLSPACDLQVVPGGWASDAIGCNRLTRRDRLGTYTAFGSGAVREHRLSLVRTRRLNTRRRRLAKVQVHLELSEMER